MDVPGGSDGKASVYNVEDLGLIPGSGRLPEKEMATHSNILAWKIPWTEESGRLQSTGLQRVGHDSATSLHFTYLFFIGICKASSDNHFAFLPFFFLGMVLIPASCTMSRTYVHSSSGTLSIRSNLLNLFVTSTV